MIGMCKKRLSVNTEKDQVYSLFEFIHFKKICIEQLHLKHNTATCVSFVWADKIIYVAMQILFNFPCVATCIALLYCTSVLPFWQLQTTCSMFKLKSPFLITSWQNKPNSRATYWLFLEFLALSARSLLGCNGDKSVDMWAQELVWFHPQHLKELQNWASKWIIN